MRRSRSRVAKSLTLWFGGFWFPMYAAASQGLHEVARFMQATHTSALLVQTDRLHIVLSTRQKFSICANSFSALTTFAHIRNNSWTGFTAPYTSLLIYSWLI